MIKVTVVKMAFDSKGFIPDRMTVQVPDLLPGINMLAPDDRQVFVGDSFSTNELVTLPVIMTVIDKDSISYLKPFEYFVRDFVDHWVKPVIEIARIGDCLEFRTQKIPEDGHWRGVFKKDPPPYYMSMLQQTLQPTPTGFKIWNDDSRLLGVPIEIVISHDQVFIDHRCPYKIDYIREIIMPEFCASFIRKEVRLSQKTY